MNSLPDDNWAIWTLVGFETLAMGAHTIEIQVRNSANFGTGVICGEAGPSLADYAGGTFNIIAIYQ